MAARYTSDYINQAEIKSDEWTPDEGDFEVIIRKFSNFVFESDCYWGWKASDRIGEVFDDKMLSFVWNNISSLRFHIVDALVNDFTNKPVCSESFRNRLIADLYDLIPRNDNCADNILRGDLVKLLHPDYNYMDEIFSLRLIDPEGSIMTRWHVQGMAYSKDPAFYAYLWSEIKRSSGYIDKKIEVAKNMINNDAMSEKVIKEAASNGTKKLKRFFISELGCKMTYYRQKLRYMDEDEALYGFYQNNNSKLEAYMLLFANFDDDRSLSTMADVLSIDNLPWIMPLLGKYRWISQSVERRIAQQENQ